MEPVSLAIGIVPLVGLFTTFFDMYEKIRILRDVGESLEQEQERLRLESERVRYIKEKYDLDRFDEDSKRLLDMVLRMLNAQLAEIKELIIRHHPELRNDELHNTDTTATTAKPPCLGSGRTSGRRIGILNRIRWAAGDKGDLGRGLDKLHFTVNTLYSFATSEAERARNDFRLRTHALRTLDLAVTMDPAQYPGIAKAARVKQLLQASLSNPPAPQGHTAGIHASTHQIPVGSIRWHRDGGLSQAMDSPWATGSRGAEFVVVEWRGPFLGGSLSLPAAGRRLDQIYELLRAMHESEQDEEADLARADGVRRAVDFAQLQCVGWTLASELSLTRIGLVFRYPQNRHEALPSSLRDLISASRSPRFVPVPALDQRFDLALGVTYAVANIISVGWTHRTVRSENMLSFGVGGGALSKLYLVGFTYARPGDNSVSEFSDLPQGRDWAFYRLPTALAATLDDSDIFDDDTTSPVLTSKPLAPAGSAAQDLYGLGIVLLEIGHWTTAERMSKAKGIDGDLQAFRERELPLQVEKLAARCGTIYRDVVCKCLDPTNWGQDNVTDNLANVLQNLKLCRA